ncbi:MAG: class I SAM-dependent methyltransferase [Acidobacteriota bacterium]|nr:class I SAM-dependent methyltransferase [Acidobacteriota bacterium]
MPALLFRAYQSLANKIIPGNRHSQVVFYEWLQQVVTPESSWLDLGCGRRILPAWMDVDESVLVAQCRLAVGIDLDLSSLISNRILRDRVLGNLEQAPFDSEVFDIVTANMVVEHLANPVDVLREIKRVLRPGGRFLFHTPNRKALPIGIAAHTPDLVKMGLVRLLEQRRSEDVFPTHYRMNVESDIQKMAQSAGFQVERIAHVNSSAITAALGPLALPELLYLRALQSERLSALRSNLLVVLTSRS